MKSSLARNFIAAFCVIGILMLVTGVGLYHVSTAATKNAAERAPAYAPALLSSQIAERTRPWSRATQSIAQSPLALRYLKSTHETERRELLATLRGLYPDLVHVQLINNEQASGQLPIPAQLSPQQKYLIEKTLSDSDSATPLRAQSLTLSVSEAVRDPDGSVIGYVLIEHDMSDIRTLFSTSPLIDGYAELQQANGTLDTLLKRGNEQIKSSGVPQTLILEGTPWQLSIWHPPLPGGIARNLYQSFWVFGAALLILAGLIMTYSYYLSNQMLQADITELIKLFSDVTHERIRKRYDVEMKEMHNGFQVMYQLAKLMVGKHKQVINSAGIDHLSQVGNRRSFEAKQHEVFARVNEGWAHSLLILDIDDFKQVNDTYGHDAGDQLIIQFGKALKDNLRSSDFVARLGGDEFCVIFPNTPIKKGIELAERLRSNLPQYMQLLPDVVHRLYWSGGISEYSRSDQSENAALSRADQALLDAKRAGRNRTEIKAAA